jgi:hypothetical protein
MRDTSGESQAFASSTNVSWFGRSAVSTESHIADLVAIGEDG